MSETSVERLLLVPVGERGAAVPEAGDRSMVQSVEAACFGLAAVAAYGSAVGAAKSASVAQLVPDLLTDLMHLCTQSGLVFDEVLATASQSYLADVRGPSAVVLTLPCRT